MSKVEIKSNKAQASIESATQYMDTLHGHAMIVFSIISPANKGINASLTFDNISQLTTSSSHMLNAVLLTKENKVLLRSYKDNGTFKSEYSGRLLTEDTSSPSSSDMFINGAKLILDIETDTKGQTWTFYRIHESQPRIMNLILRGA
jgi:hypothetical protein